jgi:hypothetical protein
MGIQLIPAPVRVSQGSAPTCWAACTTSWLTVNKDRPQLNMKQLVDRYGDPKLNGGITMTDPKWEQLRANLRWTNSTIALIVAATNTNNREKQLTLIELADTIEETLFTRGYILLVDNHTPGTAITKGISHMYVVYGITQLSGGGYDMLVMDPSPQNRTRVTVGTFLNHHIALIGCYEKKAVANRVFR